MKSIPSPCYAFVLLIVPLLAGCGSAEAEAGADPFRDAVGETGVLHFQVDAEAPLIQGANDLLVSIRDASTHMPFTEASVDISAIMPSMAHDAPHAASIEERDGGTYITHGLALPMAGRWYVDIKATRQDMSDAVRFTYDIH
jgi:hypothetical protein